jgi:GGDEF domain-containing protein
VVLAALRHGVLWLPPEAVRRCPGVLGVLLDQADALGHQRQDLAQLRTALAQSDARVERLLDMLWEATPIEGPSRWFSQRHMLERLDEEVERSRRSGAPLTVVLGELAPGQAQQLAGLLAQRIGKNKRRSDVAGHYGGHGFLMVLPQITTQQAVGACQRLRGVLAHSPHDLAAVHACFGLASLPADQASVPALLRRAEERLDRARASGDGIVAE